jgi:hypothetical protein
MGLQFLFGAMGILFEAIGILALFAGFIQYPVQFEIYDKLGFAQKFGKLGPSREIDCQWAISH